MPDSKELLAPVQPILMFLFAEKHNCYFKVINYSQKEIKISLVWGCFSLKKLCLAWESELPLTYQLGVLYRVESYRLHVTVVR